MSSLNKRVFLLVSVILFIFAFINLLINIPKIQNFIFQPQYTLPSTTNKPGIFNASRRTNYTLFNLNNEGSITTLVLATFNPEDQEIDFINLDPNINLDIAHGFGYGNLSQIFQKSSVSRNVFGLDVLKQTISDNFGVPLDGYMYFKNINLDKEKFVNLKKNLTGVFNLWKVIKLRYLFEDNLKSDLSLADFYNIYQKIWQVRSDKINYRQLADIYYEDNKESGKSLNKGLLDNFVLKIFKDQEVEKEAAKVEVKNGTGKSLLATRASHLINNLGVEVVAIDNAELENIEKTLVIDYNGKPKTANRLAQVFDGEVISRPSEEGRRGDIVVVVGFNYYRSLNIH